MRWFFGFVVVAIVAFSFGAVAQDKGGAGADLDLLKFKADMLEAGLAAEDIEVFLRDPLTGKDYIYFDSVRKRQLNQLQYESVLRDLHIEVRLKRLMEITTGTHHEGSSRTVLALDEMFRKYEQEFGRTYGGVPRPPLSELKTARQYLEAREAEKKSGGLR